MRRFTPLLHAGLAGLVVLTSLLLASPKKGLGAEYEDAYRAYRAAVSEQDLDTALIYADKSHRLAVMELGLRHPQTGILAYNLGALNYQLDRYRDARAALEEALETYGQHHEKHAQKNFMPVLKLAMTYRVLDEIAKSERFYVRAMEILEKNSGRDDPKIAEILIDLIPLARTLKQPKRLRSYALRALHILNQAPEGKSLEIARLHVNLATSAMMLGDGAEVNRQLNWALKLFEAELESHESEMREFYEFAADAFEQIGKTRSARIIRRKLRELDG